MQGREAAEIDAYLVIEDRLLARTDALPVDVVEDLHSLARLAHLRILRLLPGDGEAQQSRLAGDGSRPPESLSAAA